MTELLLVRHGHVEGIDPPRFRGRADIPLTATGRDQAARAALRIARQFSPVAVYSSPMQRCVATGSAIAEACRCPLRNLDELNDIDYGELQWKLYDEAKRERPELFSLWFSAPQLVRFPGGESLQDLVARSSNALRMALEAHPGETVVFVAHDSLNRALLLQLLDQPLSLYWRLRQSPCAINEIRIESGRIEIGRVNDAAHLE